MSVNYCHHTHIITGLAVSILVACSVSIKDFEYILCWCGWSRLHKGGQVIAIGNQQWRGTHSQYWRHQTQPSMCLDFADRINHLTNQMCIRDFSSSGKNGHVHVGKLTCWNCVPIFHSPFSIRRNHLETRGWWSDDIGMYSLEYNLSAWQSMTQSSIISKQNIKDLFYQVANRSRIDRNPAEVVSHAHNRRSINRSWNPMIRLCACDEFRRVCFVMRIMHTVLGKITSNRTPANIDCIPCRLSYYFACFSC